MFADLVRNERGAVLVEFTIVATMLMLLTFGVVEFGYLFWQFNSAEKATQLGVRKAVVTSPVATGLATADCGNANVTPGTLCSAAGTTSFGTIVCTGDASFNPTCTGCAGGVSCASVSSTSFQTIVNVMQAAFPLILPQNVTVTYAYAGLGFAGRPTPVPVITVGLGTSPATPMTFTFFGLEGISGFNTLTMPDFRATLTAEDIDTCAPGLTSC